MARAPVCNFASCERGLEVTHQRNRIRDIDSQKSKNEEVMAMFIHFKFLTVLVSYY